MAVGQGSLISNLSYISIGREITFGTYTTCTAGLNFLSGKMTTKKEFKILEEIQTSRTNSNGISLGKTVEGEIEFYFSPINLASNYLLHNAFGGGPITSATATGETVGGAAMTHTIDIANFAATYSSLCLNMRKGQVTAGKVFQYDGIRVNEFGIVAELDEALKCTASLLSRDSTVTSNDVSSVLTTLTQVPLSFVSGRFSVEATTAAVTTTSFWHVQSMELKLSNNLISDSSSRRIGTDVLQDIPAGMASIELNATIRFDTTTAFDAMIAGTRLVAEFEFLGDTMTGSAIRQGLKMTMPNVRIKDAGDPEIGGPNEMLTSQVTFAVLRDPTTSGYAIQTKVTNNTLSYA